MKPLAVCTVVNFGIADGLWFWHYCLWYNQLTPLVWLSYLKCFQLNIRINWRSLNPVALSGKYTKLELSFLIFSVTLWSLLSESQHRRMMFQGSSHLPSHKRHFDRIRNQNSQGSGLKYAQPITVCFAHVTTVLLSWRVKKLVDCVMNKIITKFY